MTYIRMEDYEINSHTMALLAKENEDGQVYTEVFELGDRFDMTKCPSDIVDDSCRYFASSLEGRLAGTKQVTNYTHKPPIVVSEAMSIYFFPIISPKRKDCTWIAHKYVLTYVSEPDHTITVHFTNGESVNLPVSYGMFANQIQRAAHLQVILQDRFRQADRIAETFS